MKITKKQIKDLSPCNDGWKWYLENQEEDLETLLLKTNEHRSDWARWIFTSVMDKMQCVEISIFAAKEVLHLFEDKCPDDKRPRQAIEAAQKYLEDPTDKNRSAATAAYAYAVDAADAVAYAAAYAAAAAADAAYAADAVAYATAAYAAYAAVAYATAAYAYAAAKKELQVKIIIKAVGILER